MTDSLTPDDRWEMRRSRLLTLLIEDGLQGIAVKIKDRGILDSTAYAGRQVRYSMCIAIARRWDRKHGVETNGQIELDKLDIAGPNKAMGAPAVSTSPKTFRYLSRYFPKLRTNVVYVDIGAGKGRTLLLASLLGFRRVIGVEFASELCDRAKENIASFRPLSGGRDICSVIQADATKYRLPLADSVLYFGNPFALELWPAMIENIVRCLRESPRNITIILAGSQRETIRGAGRLLAACTDFVPLAGGKVPYYFDTYLPYYYECFSTQVYVPCPEPFRRVPRQGMETDCNTGP